MKVAYLFWGEDRFCGVSSVDGGGGWGGWSEFVAEAGALFAIVCTAVDGCCDLTATEDVGED